MTPRCLNLALIRNIASSARQSFGSTLRISTLHVSRRSKRFKIMIVRANICFRTSIFRFAVASCLLLFAIGLVELLRTLPLQPVKTKLSVNTKTITCALEPDDLRYRPRPETNNSEVGEILETAKLYRELLDKPLRSAIELTPNNADDFVFVTASDDRYFHRNMDAIGGVQKLFPRRTIIFYDLAGKKSPANIAKISQLCGVIYRKFNFTKYPKHVRSLYNYAWKPIIITEILGEYPVLFYFDSSIRFLSSNFSLALSQAIQNGGIVTFGFAGHTIFPATHPGMYRYLPIPKAMAIKVPVREAGHIYVARTCDLYANVVRWWAACALVEACFAPTMKRVCKIRAANVFADCHRFDQSAFNILLANHFIYDAQAYSYANLSESYDPVITVVRRGNKHKENVEICLPDGQRQFTNSNQYFNQVY